MTYEALESWISEVGIENIIWVTDIDETLVEKGTNPNDILAPAELEEQCHEIDEATEGRFFIITGRELPYVDALFPGKGLKVSAEYHNVMRLDPSKDPVAVNPKPKWDLLDDELKSLEDRHPGMMLRIKPFMRSLHYSGADDVMNDAEMKDQIQGELEGMMAEYLFTTGQEITIIDGGKVFDMGPGGLDKGHAFKKIMEIVSKAENVQGRTLYPIYFGDSPGDLPAAKVVQDLGGMFISVGEDPRVTSISDFRLDNPAQTRALVKSVIDSVQAGPDNEKTIGFQPKSGPSTGPK